MYSHIKGLALGASTPMLVICLTVSYNPPQSPLSKVEMAVVAAEFCPDVMSRLLAGVTCGACSVRGGC